LTPRAPTTQAPAHGVHIRFQGGETSCCGRIAFRSHHPENQPQRVRRRLPDPGEVTSPRIRRPGRGDVPRATSPDA
jgi:hypothetical protein